MKNDFTKSGTLRVHFFSAEERRRLLEAVEALGISTGDRLKKGYRFVPTSPNTYTINIRNKTIDYVMQPFIGAAMCSGGIRFYTAEEFCRLAELDFRVLPRFILFHVPHDGRKFPPELLPSVCIRREEFEAYHEKMRDTDAAYLIPRAHYYGLTNEEDRCCCQMT